MKSFSCLHSYSLTLEKLTRRKFHVCYANNYTQQCFSIIVEFIIDYEKQITITKIKNKEQCTIYHVSLNQCNNLQTI